MATGLLMTSEGFEQTKAELERLKSVQRKEVAERIRDSKQFGEFMENSEYDDAKVEQAVVEGRIIELEHILQNAVVIESAAENADRIGVGSRVTLREARSGKELEYTIVGPVEADPGKKKVSYESPIGAAVFGRRKGEKVQVKAPSGTLSYEIVAVVNQ
jgi:transcription elongation factor GreA